MSCKYPTIRMQSFHYPKKYKVKSAFPLNKHALSAHLCWWAYWAAGRQSWRPRSTPQNLDVIGEKDQRASYIFLKTFKHIHCIFKHIHCTPLPFYWWEVWKGLLGWKKKASFPVQKPHCINEEYNSYSNFTISHSRLRIRARVEGQNYFPIYLETQWETLSSCCSK